MHSRKKWIGVVNMRSLRLHRLALCCGPTLITPEASRASTALDALPGDLEQTIAVLEKKSKAIEKDNGAASNQKILRGLLEKL